MKRLVKGTCCLVLLLTLSSIVVARNPVPFRRTEALSSRPHSKLSKSAKASPKNANSVAKKNGRLRSAQEMMLDTGCFTGCLKDSGISPEVIQECANHCAGQSWGVCATCIGAGIALVAYCAYNCS